MSILETIIPMKQVRPGDDLDLVKEWSEQFDGKASLESEIIDFFIDNADEAQVPHGLSRPIFGATVLGVMNDFSTTGKGFAYAILIESSTSTSFTIQFDKAITGTMRFIVY